MIRAGRPGAWSANSDASSTSSASAWTTVSLPPEAPARSSSMGRKRSSFSIAITLAPASSRARVRPPGPGPISRTARFSNGPASLAILRVTLRSRRKCWPKLFLARRPYASSPWRSGGSSSSFMPPGSRSSRRVDRRFAPPSRWLQSGCRDGRGRGRRCRNRPHGRARCARSAGRG